MDGQDGSSIFKPLCDRQATPCALAVTPVRCILKMFFGFNNSNSCKHSPPIRSPTFEAQAGSVSSDGATGSGSWRSEDFSNSSGSWHSDDFCDPQAGPMVRHGMRLLVSQRSLQSNLLQKSDLTMSTGSIIQEETYSCTIESVADCSNSPNTSDDFQHILQWWPTDGAGA